jgi:hypothetical protein
VCDSIPKDEVEVGRLGGLEVNKSVMESRVATIVVDQRSPHCPRGLGVGPGFFVYISGKCLKTNGQLPECDRPEFPR